MEIDASTLMLPKLSMHRGEHICKFLNVLNAHTLYF